jgi:N-acetylmuramoyl-L-alanine amidase
MSRPVLRTVMVGVLAVFVVLFFSRTADIPLFADPEAGSDPTSDDGPASPSITDPTVTTTVPTRVGYVVTEEAVPVSEAAEEPPVTEAAPGLLFPVVERRGDWFRVFTMCNTHAWLPREGLEVGRAAGPLEGFDDAVFVVDPGHGYPDLGAVGPSGLTETEVNMDVSRRLADLLETSHDIEWETGVVSDGDSVPAVRDVVLTRDPAGPEGGEYRTGLTYRATVANAVDATAFVSIHHNTQPETTLDHPGSEAFVSLAHPGSARLGGLIVDELRRSFARFEADWTGSTGSGLVSRVEADGSDYYTVLDQAEVPAAIVEGAYISNPTEEALAMTDEFRQAYAESIYRALVRFVADEEAPIPPPEPILWDVDTGSVSMDDCLIPTP